MFVPCGDLASDALDTLRNFSRTVPGTPVIPPSPSNTRMCIRSRNPFLSAAYAEVPGLSAIDDHLEFLPYTRVAYSDAIETMFTSRPAVVTPSAAYVEPSLMTWLATKFVAPLSITIDNLLLIAAILPLSPVAEPGDPPLFDSSVIVSPTSR